MSSKVSSVKHLRDLLPVLSRLEKPPGGFSSALGLVLPSHFFDDDQNVSFDKATSTLQVRLPLLTKDRLLPNQSLVSLSTYLAMMDDVTTWALPLTDPNRNRMGVSVNLHAEWGPGFAKDDGGVGRKPGDQVNLIASVKKVGRNLGFVHAQVRDSSSGDLICFGKHVKYLPMGMLTDFLLSSTGFPLLKLYAEHGRPQKPESDHSDAALFSLFDSLQFEKNKDTDNSTFTTATFAPSNIHASLGGPIHGGCQAILMELVATEAVQRIDKSLQLYSVSVEYISSPSKKSADLHVDFLLPPNEWHQHQIIPVRVQLLGKEMLKSEGLLRFVRAGKMTTENVPTARL